MPYIGNTIRAADDYRLIDDISSSFNGSTTSFALQVAGSSPVPFPKSPQQVLISVNGVIQEPDPTGASGFNLVGTNIVFSSAPTNGHAFFGIIYATADYLNAGGNFPSGSLGAPSFTFIGDENTGLYRKSGGSVGFVSDATEIANFDSNGITISSGNIIIPDSIIHNGDANTKIRFPAVDTVTVETSGSERLRVDSNGKIGIGTNAPGDFHTKASNLVIHSSGDTGMTISSGTSSDGRLFFADGTSGSAESEGHIRYDHATNKMHFATSDANAVEIDSSGNFLPASDSSKDIGSNSVRFANGYFDTLYGDGSNLTGINTDLVSDTSPQLGGNLDVNTKNIVFGDSGDTTDDRLTFGAGTDLSIYHDGTDSRIQNATGVLRVLSADFRVQNAANTETQIKAVQDGAVELYHNNSKKFETESSGCKIDGSLELTANLIMSDNDKIRIGNSQDLEILHDGTHSRIIDNGANATSFQTNLLRIHDNSGNFEYLAEFNANGAVELYYDNVVKFETTSAGGKLSGSALTLEDSSGTVISFDESGTRKAFIGIRSFSTHDGDGIMIQTSEAAPIKFAVNNAVKAQLNSSGHFLPGGNNVSDLGSTSLRWANLYTNDLHLSNEGHSNDVDSTWGNYTIQEGHEDLFLINNRTGKKFKFNLTEVS